MKKKKLAIALSAVTVATIGIGTMTATAALAVDTPPQFYLLDGGDGHLLADDTVLNWDSQVLGSPSSELETLETPFVGTPDSETISYFVSPRGSENTIASWITIKPAPVPVGTTNLVTPNLSLDGFTVGNWATVKAGGDYSLGVAFLKNNGQLIADWGVKFIYIHVNPGGAGTWTFAPQAVSGGTDPGTPGENAGEEAINLSAQTIAAGDGGLTLAVAANAATIGNPTLVNGQSVSTGTLPAVTVHDARVVSHPGWTLTSTVADFTNGTDSISKAQLGIKPTKTSGPAGALAGAEQTAGSAVYPSTFASADNSAVVGDTVLGGNLTFVAPVGKPAGTYTSTLTLTLIGE